MKDKIAPIIFTALLILSIPFDIYIPKVGADGSNPGNCVINGPDGPVLCRYFWDVVKGSKVRVPGFAYSNKRVCTEWYNPTKYTGSVNCSVSKMTGSSVTVTAGLSGNWPSPIPEFNAEVSYDVEQQSTLENGATYPAPTFTHGYIYARAVFGDRYSVKQQRHMCIYGGGRADPKAVACYPPGNVFDHAITEKYDHTEWSFSYNNLPH